MHLSGWNFSPQTRAMNLARLKAARKHCGLAQHELAEKLKIGRTLPGQWERGERRIHSDMVLKLANELGVTASWLLGEGVIEEPIKTSNITGPRSILADAGAPPGLVELARRREIVDALNVEPEEWAALRTFEPKRMLSSDGYLVVLLVMRGTLHPTTRFALRDYVTES